MVHPIRDVRDVRYMSKAEGSKGSALLDVYAPTDAGPWPVVVMLHGGGTTKDDYEGWATKTARRRRRSCPPGRGWTTIRPRS